MLTRALHKTLYAVYPAVILMAAIASSGMRLVQAQGPDLGHLFPTEKEPQLNHISFSPMHQACSVQDQLSFANKPGTCPDPSSDQLLSEGHQFVNRNPASNTAEKFN